MSHPAFTLASPETGTTYHLYVDRPDGAASPGPWPVLLVLDGDDQFREAGKAYHRLRAAEKIPPLLLVGVGYGASYAKPTNHRARDYTPVRAHDEPTSGGAELFSNFIRQTLWPELARRYSIQTTGHGIMGYSLGGLFVLSTWLEPAPLFEKYLAGSPSIWWSDGAILSQIAARHSAEAELRASLFFSVGEKDSRSMTRDVDRLEQQLAALSFQGLAATARRFPGKNHFNAIGITFETGLAALYGVSATD